MTTHTDTERAEWLVAHWANFGQTTRLVSAPPTLHRTGKLSGEPPRWASTIFCRVPCEHEYLWHCYDAPDRPTDWRAAVDVAMAAPPCTENGCVKRHDDERVYSDHPDRHRVRELEAEVVRLTTPRAAEG